MKTQSIILVLFGCTVLIADQVPATPEKHRTIIMLFDLEGINENIGRPGRIYLTNKLQSAVAEQAAPILVNASLWGAFIEKRSSMKQLSQMADTEEKKTLKVYNAIKDRLNYWFDYFKKAGFDAMQSKQMMLAHTNDELYSKAAMAKLEKSEFVLDDQAVTLASYLTSFNNDEWEGYTNNKSLFLLIPKKYSEQKEKEIISPLAKGAQISAREHALGLKVDHLTHIADLEDPTRCYFAHSFTQNTIADSLKDFFVTHEDRVGAPSPYSLNVVFSGHGGHRYRELKEKMVQPKTDTIIADVTVADFQKTLDFFQNHVATKSVHYASCSGGGNHIKMTFDDAGAPAYSYAIITDCLNDGYSYCMWRWMHFPDAQGDLLAADEIAYDEGEGWHLRVDHKYQWKKYLGLS